MSGVVSDSLYKCLSVLTYVGEIGSVTILNAMFATSVYFDPGYVYLFAAFLAVLSVVGLG